MPSPPTCALLLALACALGLGTVAACGRDEQLIKLPVLPPAPDAATRDEDAGEPIPDGSVPCKSNKECDDGVACTIDRCVHPGYCSSVTDNASCSDNVFCNGIEVCEPKTGCRPGNTMTCDDMNTCTVDSCSEAQKACLHAPRDFDHDGEVDIHCPGGTDCDDFDELRGSRIGEVCDDQIDNDCDDMTDESDCGMARHDTCSDALDVSAEGVFEVPLDGTKSDYLVSCNESFARDVVFTFELKEPRDVKLGARGIFSNGGDESATLTLETKCGDGKAEVECRQGFPSDLRRRALPAGRYYVVASSFSATSLLLTFSTSAPTPAPTNQSCSRAIDVSAGGRFESDFIDVKDVQTAPCADPGQPDLFYTFTLDAESDVEISAISDEDGRLAFSLKNSCSSKAATLRCQSGEPAQARVHQLPKGTYVLALEGPTSHEVAFVLDVAIMPPTPPPAGDECSDPLAIAVGETKTVLLSDKQNVIDSSCQRFGPDAVFAVHVSTATDLSIELDGDQQLTVFALQTQCGVPSSELECRAGTPVETRIRNVQPGDYFMVVESETAQSVDLKVDSLPLTQPISVTNNDTCQTATLIPPEGALFQGDTTLLFNDYEAACGSGTASKDAVFKLVLPDAKHVVASIDASFDSVLYRYADERSGAELCSNPSVENCDDDGSSDNDGLLDEQLNSGTYYYVVDGFKDDNAGSYLFQVTITDK